MLGTGTCNVKKLHKGGNSSSAVGTKFLTIKEWHSDKHPISVLGTLPSWRAPWQLTGIDHPCTLLALLWAAGLCCWCRPAATQQLLNDRNYQDQEKIHCPNMPKVAREIRSRFWLLKCTLKTHFCQESKSVPWPLVARQMGFVQRITTDSACTIVPSLVFFYKGSIIWPSHCPPTFFPTRGFY